MPATNGATREKDPRRGARDPFEVEVIPEDS